MKKRIKRQLKSLLPKEPSFSVKLKRYYGPALKRIGMSAYTFPLFPKEVREFWSGGTVPLPKLD